MSGKLPPGVKSTDIPGSRPKDKAYEQFAEKVLELREVAEAFGCDSDEEMVEVIARALDDNPRPDYDYKCDECGHTFDEDDAPSWQENEAEIECPECGTGVDWR